ncbi:MAG: TerB family tellurite resistance protein [Planctomycetota bacterium]
MLSEHEAEAVLTLALMAAMADGRSASDEREQIKSLLESLAEEHELPSLGALQQRVLLKQATLDGVASALGSADARRTAFEIAVCVADADGATTEAEQRFLDTAERALGLNHDEAVAFERDAEAVALAPIERDEALLDATALLGSGGSGDLAVPNAPAGRTAAPVGPVDPVDAEVDKLILRYSVLNGALELLPQNLATMAILPLQTRMVYAVGKRYGHALDAGHIKEFVATLGLGATSQMLENFARKTLGKLVKKTLGKTAGKLAKAATGPMMTFAATYAMGRVAKAYYAGGRTLSAVDLRSMFQRDLAQGRSLYDEYRPEVERHARGLQPAAVLDMVRGKRAV